jgi:hypothetical protein
MFDALRSVLTGGRGSRRARRWYRMIMTEPARLTLRSGEVRSVIVTQLSAGGARVTSAKPLHKGQPVRFDLLLGTRPHGVDAEVVHGARDGRGLQWHIGLRFTGVGAAGDQAIAEFLTQEQRRRETGFAVPRNARD